jgi:hypothetical protein
MLVGAISLTLVGASLIFVGAIPTQLGATLIRVGAPMSEEHSH